MWCLITTVREYAYDAHPPASGKLAAAVPEAKAKGLSVVDMKQDWKKDPLINAVLTGDKGLPKLLAITHSGMTTDDFDKRVLNGLIPTRIPIIQTQQHPEIRVARALLRG